MFEGLRGLRDAVAPESGNLAGGEAINTAATTATDESNNNTTNNGNQSITAATATANSI
jgi:hypothetical protein